MSFRDHFTIAGDQHDSALRAFALFWLGAIVVIVGGVAIFGKERPALDASVAYGCFATDYAPPIRISRDGLQLQGLGRELLSGYSLDYAKGGDRVLRPDAGFQLAEVNGRYRWQAANRPSNFWRFEDGTWLARLNKAADTKKLNAFDVWAADQHRFRYERAAEADCRA